MVEPNRRMLAIFDNDGTICDTQEVEGRCYAEAIEAVTGRRLSTTDWETFEEPTSSAMVREFLAGHPELAIVEREIEREFVRRLREEQPRSPGDFQPIPGAVEFIGRLRAKKICEVAIATGCFAESARYKLACCGVALEDFPHATSSDTPRRREIIPLAAARAGRELGEVVYFGDAPWDAKVCAALGIPMIGIGRRIERLQKLGIREVFADFSDGDAVLEAMSRAQARVAETSQA